METGFVVCIAEYFPNGKLYLFILFIVEQSFSQTEYKMFKLLILELSPTEVIHFIILFSDCCHIYILQPGYIYQNRFKTA